MIFRDLSQLFKPRNSSWQMLPVGAQIKPNFCMCLLLQTNVPCADSTLSSSNEITEVAINDVTLSKKKVGYCATWEVNLIWGQTTRHASKSDPPCWRSQPVHLTFARLGKVLCKQSSIIGTTSDKVVTSSNIRHFLNCVPVAMTNEFADVRGRLSGIFWRPCSACASAVLLATKHLEAITMSIRY